MWPLPTNVTNVSVVEHLLVLIVEKNVDRINAVVFAVKLLA